MAYNFTFEKIETIEDSIFDSLWADSKEDLKGGTFIFPEEANTDELKKEHTKQAFVNTVNGKHWILVKNNGTACMWIAGFINPETESDMYNWHLALVGKVNNSKVWTRSSEWHSGLKTYLQSISMKGYTLPIIKDQAIDTYFTQAEKDGVTLGTHTRVQSSEDERQVFLKWVY